MLRGTVLSQIRNLVKKFGDRDRKACGGQAQPSQEGPSHHELGAAARATRQWSCGGQIAT